MLQALEEVLRIGTSFGAPTEREVEMASLISKLVPSIEKVRLVNSGTEATMSAIRLARGFTGRERIVKFDGCYHGHGDSLLVRAGSGVATLGLPDSPGVPRALAELTSVLPFNNAAALERLGIHPYDAVIGSAYNPALHERVGSMRMEGMGPLLVAEQRERGYASQQPDFVLRRPKVIVSE